MPSPWQAHDTGTCLHLDRHTTQAHAFTSTGTRHRHMLSPWQAHDTGTCFHLDRCTTQPHALTGAMRQTRHSHMPWQGRWDRHTTQPHALTGAMRQTRHSHMPWQGRWDRHVAKAHTLTDACYKNMFIRSEQLVHTHANTHTHTHTHTHTPARTHRASRNPLVMEQRRIRKPAARSSSCWGKGEGWGGGELSPARLRVQLPGCETCQKSVISRFPSGAQSGVASFRHNCNFLP